MGVPATFVVADYTPGPDTRQTCRIRPFEALGSNHIFNDPQPRPHVVMAASTITTLPVIVLFLALERYLTEGLAAGGVKG